MAGEPFETIVDVHYAEICRYLRRVVPRGTEPDDLCQVTFLRAFRAYRSLPSDANLRAWLFAIATNLCRNHFRSERRRRAAMQAASEEPQAADGDWPEGEAVSSEARSQLEEIIGCLPFKQRLAFTMRKLHDLGYDTIGRSLDCSAEKARAHVFQALRKIRHGLGKIEE